MRTTQLCLFLFVSCCALRAQDIDAPRADKIPHHTIIHGDTLKDFYFWMRDKHSPDVINYLYANNAYADNRMKESRTLQKVLFEEFRSRIKEDYTTRPSKNKNYYYYSRSFADKQYPALYRKKDSLMGKEQLVLDMNKLAEEFMYFSITLARYSPDQSLLAYTVDTKGSGIGTLYIKHIDADSIFTERIDSVLDLVWASDSKTFWYSKAEPKTNRSYRIYRHIIGGSHNNDILIFEEPDKTYQIGLSKSASDSFIFMTVSKTKSNEIWYWNSNNPTDKPTLFFKRQSDLLYSLNHYEDKEFYIHTNYQAPDWQLMRSSVTAKGVKEWVNVIPHRPGIHLDSYLLLKDYMVWDETQHAENRILIKKRNAAYADTLQAEMPCASLSYSVEDYNYHETREIRFSATNMVNPAITYTYNPVTKEKTFFDLDSLNQPYHPSDYATERVWAAAVDGVRVPITIAYKKGMQKNGNNPLLLEAYGSYGASSMPEFSSTGICYLNRGFILATAHVRGGHELGENWYQDGKLLNKKNTFTDFIACAQQLITEKYTSKEKLAAQGGSAGGLLMGAVVNMRPDLFHCVVAQVPFVDVINTMLDESIPLTTFEFDEWGNPKIKKFFDYMKTYSPYDNVRSQPYPHLLVTAGYNDANVGYWEPAKWVAKLRETKTDTNLLLFKTNMEGGHGGSSGRYSALKEQAFVMAFIMQSLGVRERYIQIKGKIVDEYGEGISYANAFLEGTGKGTLTNTKGEFELQVKEFDKATLVFQSLGYERQKFKITMDSRITSLNVTMRSEYKQLKTVTVLANAKDPAWGIIKQAIKHREENNNRVKGYSADVYMKTNVRLIEIPKTIPKFLLVNGEHIDSNDIGLIYLSESVAKYHFQKPDNVKEQMLASKVAGMKQGFSWNRVADAFFNLYEPTLDLSYYSDRPFISPIAPLANLCYKYKFKGTIFLDKKEVKKIEVTPLRKGDACFTGYLYITDEDYQVYAADLFITRDAQIDLVDTVVLKQEMQNINGVWVPLQLTIGSHIKIFGFRASDVSIANMSNVELNPTFPQKFFGNEVFRIEKNANKKDSTYWIVNRSTLLTAEEEKHYYEADSIHDAQNTPAYLDSMQRLRNKPKWDDLLLSGYTYSKENDSLGRYVNFNPLLFSFGYNTIEGLYLNYGFTWSTYNRVHFKYLSYISPVIRYGFANSNLALGATIYKSFGEGNVSGLALKTGRFIEQYNRSEPIATIMNAAYTLLAAQNYMKILQKDIAGLTWSNELLNGLYAQTNIQVHQRKALINHTSYTWGENKNTFTSNNPLNSSNDAPAFATHTSTEYQISLRYLHKQKYEMIDGHKNATGSKYPDVYVTFKQGLALDGLSFNYQYIEAGTGKELNLNAMGTFTFDVTAGTFLNGSGMAFADYKHFNGNQTLFIHNPENRNVIGEDSRQRLTGFHALDYYTYSTNQSFIELHSVYNLKGMLSSKIPLFRKLKARELVGLNFMSTPAVAYNEIYFGLDHIFSVLHIDAGRVTSSGQRNDWFVRFALGFSF